MSIKILHIVSGSISDGASKGAIYLHKYLLKTGTNSKVLFNSIDNVEEKEVKNVFYYKKNFYEKFIYFTYKLIFKIIYNLVFFKKSKYIFTTGLYGVNIKKNELFNDADVIHLHSVNDFISLNTIKTIKKPIVWSLRDWWFMTGGYHLPNNLNQNKPILEHKILSFLSKIKKNFVINQKNIHFTAISNTIKKDFESVYNNTNIDRIYNLTDQENFYPENSNDLKITLNINTTKKIILFGAQRISDPSKGSQYLESILSKLNPNKYFIISFGVNDKIDLNKYKLEYKNFGEIKDHNMLRKIYCVSDLFLCTSIHESFGKTVLESLLCSTPVVAFDVGAVNEIITHQKNGFLAKPFNTDDFLLGIEYVLRKKNDWEKYAKISERLDYLKPFTYQEITKLYLNKYEEMVKPKNI